MQIRNSARNKYQNIFNVIDKALTSIRKQLRSALKFLLELIDINIRLLTDNSALADIF